MPDTATVARRRALTRRVLGIVLATVTAAVLTGFVLGRWNPWDLVVLTEYFGNWPLGLLLVSVLALGTSWLLLPVRHEVAQGRRIVLRIACAVAVLVGLVCFGIVGPTYQRQTSELGRSPDGDRAVVLVSRGPDQRELHVWVGRGLSTRDVGVLGRACGQIDVHFPGRDEIEISTNYGDVLVRLDPATGAPLNTLGSSCRLPG